MTAEELAGMLDGREYGTGEGHVTIQHTRLAKDAGLLIIHGESDDLMEFRGAFEDELGAYNGTIAYVHNNGVLEEHENCRCSFCGYETARKACAEVKAEWGENGWTITTTMPHARFNIMEDGEVFCRGIVIDVMNLPRLKGES